MAVLKFSQVEQDSVIEILAAILHIGNLEYLPVSQITNARFAFYWPY